MFYKNFHYFFNTLKYILLHCVSRICIIYTPFYDLLVVLNAKNLTSDIFHIYINLKIHTHLNIKHLPNNIFLQ
jgi:hypothetical protein